MTDYYVSPSGSDSNNGLGPDASDGTNKPFLTWDKALSIATDDDTAYFGPGLYRNTAGTVDNSGSLGHLISFIGDPQNTKGFKDGSGVLLAPDYVRICAFSTDDSTTVNITLLTINNKSYLWFENLILEGGGTNTVTISGGATNITFKRCAFTDGDANAHVVAISPTAGTPAVVLLDECYVFSPGGYAVIVTGAAHTDEYDCEVTCKNCVLISLGLAAFYNNPTAGTAECTGGYLYGCTLIGAIGVRAGAGWTSTCTYPLTVRNCFIIAGGTAAFYQSGGSLTDCMDHDYNVVWATAIVNGVEADGGHSINGASTSGTDTKMFRFHMLQSWMYGFAPRPPFSPMSIGVQRGAGTDLSHTTDLIGMRRPSGAGAIVPTIGALEVHNYGTKHTVLKDAGDASLKMVGPGDHEILIPVDASSTTVKIKGRMDSGTYGGTSYPQAVLLDLEGFAGISGNTETKTMASTQDVWEELTFTAFTPTRKGVVRLRLVNRGSGADDICYWDTLSVT